MNGTIPTEAQFISYGMTKEKWPYVTPEVVQHMLHHPNILDDETAPGYVDCFYKYYDWYWAENR